MTGTRKRTVYMAGPDVFLPDAAEIGRRKRELCGMHGLVGICPLDNALGGTSSDISLSQRIYHANIG